MAWKGYRQRVSCPKLHVCVAIPLRLPLSLCKSDKTHGTASFQWVLLSNALCSCHTLSSHDLTCRPWRQLLAERGMAPRHPTAGPRWYQPMIEGPRRLAAAFLRRNTAAALASAATHRRMVEATPQKDASSSYCSTA